MCRNHLSQGPRDEKMERLKFFKHLKMFLIFNAVLLFFSVKNGGNMSFMYMTFFWGIAVANHYFKVFGQSAYRAPLDDSVEDADYFLDDMDRPLSRKSEKPRWRDKDLV